MGGHAVGGRFLGAHERHDTAVASNGVAGRRISPVCASVRRDATARAVIGPRRRRAVQTLRRVAQSRESGLPRDDVKRRGAGNPPVYRG